MSPKEPVPERSSSLALLYLSLFLSGSAALIYQICWIRVLGIEVGNSIYAMSSVLGTFMGGLALGSLVVGAKADRWANPLLCFARMEFGIGSLAFLFLLYHPYLAGVSGAVKAILPWTIVGRALLTALLVVGPAAFLMGATIPLLGRWRADRASERPNLSKLYAANTTGALLGCIVCGFWLVPWVGLRTTILIAACGNILSGLLLRQIAVANEQNRPELDRHSSLGPIPRRSAALASYSGAAVLSVEVLWTRQLTNFLSGNVLIFTSILAATLLGASVGAWIIGRMKAPRVEWFLIGSAMCLAASVAGMEQLARLFNTTQASVGVTSFGATTETLVILVLGLTLPNVVFGCVFPVLLREVRASSQSGADTGRLMAVNTVGAIVGSFTGGFVMIELLGVNVSLLLLASGYGMFAFWFQQGSRWKWLSSVVVVSCLLLLVQPSFARPQLWYNGGFRHVRKVADDQVVFLKEGIEATVGVREERGVRTLLINGLIVADTSHSDLWDLLLKAHLPMLLHPDPQRVGVIGLGAGVSLGAIQAYPQALSIECAEISPGVRAAVEYFELENGRCWEDQRTRIILNDGRNHLRLATEYYDVLTVDPVDPPVCNLYTQEFFQLCSDRLKAGGYMVQWLPLFRLSRSNLQSVMKAFLNVFGNATLWYDGTSVLLIGVRDGELRIDWEQVRARWSQREVQRNLRLIGKPPPLLLIGTFIGDVDAIKSQLDDAVANTDDQPWLEFDVLRAEPLIATQMSQNLEMIRTMASPIADILSTNQDRASLIKSQQLTMAMLQYRILVMSGRHAEGYNALKQLQAKFKLTDPSLKSLRAFLGDSP